MTFFSFDKRLLVIGNRVNYNTLDHFVRKVKLHLLIYLLPLNKGRLGNDYLRQLVF